MSLSVDASWSVLLLQHWVRHGDSNFNYSALLAQEFSDIKA